MSELIGRTVGQYRVVEQIGEGGMATVYRAYQPNLNRYVALKVLPPIHAKQPGFTERFRREAEAVANLNHPNILPVFDFGQEQGYSFIAMRYVEGARTLKEVMADPLDLAQVADLIGQVAAALDHAHRQGVIHRDVKPSNVMMDGDWALLGDFGLAKMTEISVKLTGSGVGVGTPAYMSPEQGQGLEVDLRTDIYSLGIILFEMLTGQIPHNAETPLAIVLKRINEPLPLPRAINPDIPAAVERVILKALARNPDDRYASAGEMAQALKQAVCEAAAPAAADETLRPAAETPPTVQPVETPLPAGAEEALALPVEKPSAPTPPPARPTFPWTPASRWVAGIGAGVVVIVLLVWGLSGGFGGQGQPTATPTTPTVAALAPTSTPTVPSLTSTPVPTSTSTPRPPTPTPRPPTSTPITTVTRIREKDGAVMVYVPAGEFWMGSDDGGDNEKPRHKVYVDVFWIDQTEVTNVQYKKCVDEGACSPPASSESLTRDSYYGNPEYDDYPVIYVSWHQAQEYAEWVGGRLPTEAEWEYAARGADGRIYPWGNGEPNDSLLNYDDNVGDTAEVGSYPEGASWCGAMNMAGNVWEWVADWYSERYYANSPDENPLGPDSGDYRVVRGGSFRYDQGGCRCACRNGDGPDSRDGNGGFRVAFPAGTVTPIPTREAGATRVREKDGAVMVHVPAGEFWMGSTDADIDAILAACDGCQQEWYEAERPQREVHLDAFWIDQTEVTNAQYASFLTEQGNQEEGGVAWLDMEWAPIERTDGEYRPKSGYEYRPVVNVTWYGARAYCEWAGRRLPTEAEWEKAARGDDKRTYPWGEDIDCDHANYAECIGGSTEVGSYRAGASPYGALDMAGNVWEWAADWYDKERYKIPVVPNPLGPKSGNYRVLRGGSTALDAVHARAANRGWSSPDGSSGDVGFRCAHSLP